MMDDEIKTGINSKVCVAIALFLIIIEIGIVCYIGFMMRTPEIYYPMHNKFMSMDSNVRNILSTMMYVIPAVLIPAAVIFLFSAARTTRRLNKHKRYLRAKYPNYDFQHLTRSEVNVLVSALDILNHLKTGFLSVGSTLGTIKAGVQTTSYLSNRNKVYKDNLDMLKQLHPEIDFDHPKKHDKEVIEDELDVIMFVKEHPVIP